MTLGVNRKFSSCQLVSDTSPTDRIKHYLKTIVLSQTNPCDLFYLFHLPVAREYRPIWREGAVARDGIAVLPLIGLMRINSYLVALGFFQQVMFFDSKKPYVLFRTRATGTSVRKFVGIDANIESATEKFPRCGERSQWAHRICHFTQLALFRQQF